MPGRFLMGLGAGSIIVALIIQLSSRFWVDHVSDPVFYAAYFMAAILMGSSIVFNICFFCSMVLNFLAIKNALSVRSNIL